MATTIETRSGRLAAMSKEAEVSYHIEILSSIPICIRVTANFNSEGRV